MAKQRNHARAQAQASSSRPPPAVAVSGATAVGGSVGIPLWQQLSSVAGALQSILAGRSGTAALLGVPIGLRPGVQALLFQVLRCLGRAQVLRSALVSRTPPPAADALLCTALALAWDAQSAPYEPFTLVNQTVEAAKRQRATQGKASFINACLRRFLREQSTLVAASDSNELARWNHPPWWVRRLQADYPTQWEHILRANNAQPPMALRVNPLKSTPEQYQKALAAINIEAICTGDQGLELRRPVPVHVLPGFDQGVVSVQDAAAQRAAPLLLHGLASEGRALRVLDACAAPGGKTAHLLELASPQRPLEVTALEIDPERAVRIGETLQRLGLHATVLVADAGRPQDWWQQHCSGEPFDAILLDAPCTASGIVRRHPDVRWLRRASDVEQLARIQAQLIATLWPLVRVGGRMLYCTCSVFRAEGEQQVQTFLANNTHAQLLPSPGHLVPGSVPTATGVPDNSGGDHDGFFYALLQKRDL